MKSVLDRASRIDVVVNKAGHTLVGAQEETSSEGAKQLFDTNFFEVSRGNKAVLSVMRDQGSGRLIYIGLMTGFLPAPYQGIYAASKHALEGYSEYLNHEVRQFGIRISVVDPGFTRTEIDKNAVIARQALEPYDTERESVLGAVRPNNATGQTPDAVAAVVLKCFDSPSPKSPYDWPRR